MSACPQCGTVAKPTDKFCNTCGTPLAAAPPPAYGAPPPPPPMDPGYGAAAQQAAGPARCQMGHEIAPGASYCAQGHPIALDAMQFAADPYAQQQGYGQPPPQQGFGAPPPPPPPAQYGYAPPPQQAYGAQPGFQQPPPPPPYQPSPSPIGGPGGFGMDPNAGMQQGYGQPPQAPGFGPPQGFGQPPPPPPPAFPAPQQGQGFGAPPPQPVFNAPAAPPAANPYAAPAASPAAAPDPNNKTIRGFLVSYQTNTTGDFWPLPGGRLIVGRTGAGDGIDIPLSDPTISSRHATFVIDGAGGSISLEDTGSTNGTFVNDEHIGFNGRRELKDGDRVRFGGFTTIVKIVGRV